jgi:hypothetical protein
MLLGREPLNTGALEESAREVERNPLASEAYWESVAQAGSEEPVILSRKDLEEAVEALTGEFGPKVKVDARRGKWTLSAAGIPRTVFSDTVHVLEQDPVVVPLTPLEPRLVELANSLSRPGERLPLVVGTY